MRKILISITDGLELYDYPILPPASKKHLFMPTKTCLYENM